MRASKKRVTKRKPIEKKKIKLHWKTMEIMKVKLNPEQAVLSCCDSDIKAFGDWPSAGFQCHVGPCAAGGLGEASS